MIIYNVTVKIESAIQEDWLQWMRSIHIPDVLKTGYFKEAELRRVLVEHEDGDITYAIQYKAPDMAAIADYQKNMRPNCKPNTLKDTRENTWLFAHSWRK